MSGDRFGHVHIEPKRVSASWWLEPQRAGWTLTCRRRFGDFMPLDDVTDREVQILVERGHILQAMAGVRQAKSNAAIRRAVTL